MTDNRRIELELFAIQEGNKSYDGCCGNEHFRGLGYGNASAYGLRNFQGDGLGHGSGAGDPTLFAGYGGGQDDD